MIAKIVGFGRGERGADGEVQQIGRAVEEAIYLRQDDLVVLEVRNEGEATVDLIGAVGIGDEWPINGTIDVPPGKRLSTYAKWPIEPSPLGTPVRLLAGTKSEGWTERRRAVAYPDGTGLVGTDRPFPPAPPQAISDFEALFDVTLCDDYRAFLQTHNGLRTRWLGENGWPEWENGTEFTEEYQRVGKELEEDGASRYLTDMRTFFGIGTGDPYVDQPDAASMKKQNGELQFWHQRLQRFAYMVAEDGGGNVAVQIARGKRRGEMALTDHEMWFGGTSGLLETPAHFDDEPAPFASLEDADPDAVVDFLLETNAMDPIGKTFDQLVHVNVMRELDMMRRLSRFRRPG